MRSTRPFAPCALKNQDANWRLENSHEEMLDTAVHHRPLPDLVDQDPESATGAGPAVSPLIAKRQICPSGTKSSKFRAGFQSETMMTK
jgi:hypothetical protein